MDTDTGLDGIDGPTFDRERVLRRIQKVVRRVTRRMRATIRRADGDGRSGETVHDEPTAEHRPLDGK